MSILRTFFLAAGLLGLAGCSMNPGTNAPVGSVQGRVVTAGGQPVGNVQLMLSPADRGLQSAALKVSADGRFSGQVIAGNYLYHFEPLAANQAAISAVPAKYRETNGEHRVRVGEGDVELKLAK